MNASRKRAIKRRAFRVKTKQRLNNLMWTQAEQSVRFK